MAYCGDGGGDGGVGVDAGDVVCLSVLKARSRRGRSGGGALPPHL